jgi:transmembrane sensor
MKKELLIRFIKGEVSKQEEIEILNWIGKSPENEKYFLLLNNLWISQHLSDQKASPEELKEIQILTTKRNSVFLPNRRFISYAAALIILISVSFNLIQLKDSSRKSSTSNGISNRLKELNIDKKYEVYTEKGVKAKITLPDGSAVWLNSDSRITYPKTFEADIREVEFSGEAFFDVVKDSLRPLVVNTNKNFKIKVLGTKFNLKAYENDPDAQTTLYSGSIDVISESYLKGIRSGRTIVTRLEPMETCIIRDKQNPVTIKPYDTDKMVAWKDGKIIFDSTPISEVIKILERWHGTEFNVQDQSIYGVSITAKFRSESIVQIMEMIKYCSLIDYSISNNKVTLIRRKL